MLVWLHLHAWGLVSPRVGFGGAERAPGEWAASFFLKKKVVAPTQSRGFVVAVEMRRIGNVPSRQQAAKMNHLFRDAGD